MAIGAGQPPLSCSTRAASRPTFSRNVLSLAAELSPPPHHPARTSRSAADRVLLAQGRQSSKLLYDPLNGLAFPWRWRAAASRWAGSATRYTHDVSLGLALQAQLGRRLRLPAKARPVARLIASRVRSSLRHVVPGQTEKRRGFHPASSRHKSLITTRSIRPQPPPDGSRSSPGIPPARGARAASQDYRTAREP